MDQASEVHDYAYQEEQAKLLRQHEGEPSSDDVDKIVVPKDPEVNPEVYKDVEPILFRGFLSVSAKINNVPVVFKTLNHHEFERISLIAGPHGEDVGRFWNIFLAYSVFLFDSVNVLADRDRSLPQIVKLFNDMPRPARDKIVRPLSELNRRASNAIRLAEAYATEWQSRYRWMQLRGIDMTTPAVTGILGTEALGLNWAQLTWRALNQYEDLKEQHEREWENSKFVGSCMAGKGISKVYQQDTERRRKEKESRLARKDALLRHVILGEPLEDERRQHNGATLVAAHTAEELADQLRRDLRGEKDWHDFVVTEAEKKTQGELNQHQQRIVEFARAHEQEMEGRFLVGGTDMTGVTPAEMRQREQRQRAYEAQQAAQRMVVAEDERLSPERRQAFRQQWGVDGSGIPVNVSTSDQDPTNAMPVRLEDRPRQAPFRR